MKNIWILGVTGMLGSACYEILKSNNMDVVGISRQDFEINNKVAENSFPRDEILSKNTLHNFVEKFGKPNYIINAIGIVKPRINDSVESISEAYRINSVFPWVLDAFASEIGSLVLQIGTDCIYSGKKGLYSEEDFADTDDHYGKSKLIGEVQTANTKILRASIIGMELNNKYSLVSWLMNQEKNGSVNGFLNHNWNGVTTKTFAHIVKGIIVENIELNSKQHLVPFDTVNKYQLLKLISKALNRTDLEISAINASVSVDRTLKTENIEVNTRLWAAAGFLEIPRVEILVTDYLV